MLMLTIPQAGDGLEDGGGLLSEEEEGYDALNDETFGDGVSEYIL